MSNERIGCSLADAASAPAYMSYLQAASKAPPSLHVVYVNTAFETKAFAHELVPTITCTSSNVVQTILKVRGTMRFSFAVTFVFHPVHLVLPSLVPKLLFFLRLLHKCQIYMYGAGLIHTWVQILWNCSSR
ncbi:Quinolinate synthetase A [Parasponia andersonii]|uniref:quinolinate synthase n=1 Tax=Parasponia andersonii TaxID=3476 RepID=A0A2P5DGA3_PARAD|nr:Quinolinate synthetase A [Parasponia andersonii]